MKLIAEKYRKLKPTIEYLSDEVVIAQAWKKTHGYIRHHNWYADTLALDISALALEPNAKSWADMVKKKDLALYKMELVPAPKGDAWVVDSEEGWVPRASLDGKEMEGRKKKPPLRPLAHITVRDQTWGTAAMLCMADAVESAQGDCSESNFLKAQKCNVFSYGNRLLCDWNDRNEAWFRWGNGETYRKFYTDYQSFLQRPVTIGKVVSENQAESDHIFIVSLDLKKFYDYIDRNTLIERLKILCGSGQKADYCPDFWNQVKLLMSWEWDESSKKTAKNLGMNIGGSGKGLPQGLVAAGFFANAYLINFDKEMGKFIGKAIPQSPQVFIQDYCRYVDDIRLVVSIDGEMTKELLADVIFKWAQKLLTKHAGEDMLFNDAKTSVTSLSDLDNTGTLSARINQLQQDLSGPADRDILESSKGALEGLLTLQSSGAIGVSEQSLDRGLISLVKFDNDVRPDTLKRFAANRLESIMRNKRKVDVELASDMSNSSQTSLDNESELLAKKLVWAWMQDPSLALVLRKAIEIYPSPIIAEPAFEAIYTRCSFSRKNTDKVTSAMFDYLLADLFRSCVDFQGYFQRIDYPGSSDPDAVLALACRFAQKAISTNQLPNFVKSQALLLLAVMQKPIFLKEGDSTIQHSLHAILAGAPTKAQRQRLALYEVAAQISGDTGVISDLLIENLIRSEDDGLIRSLLDDLAKRGGEFWVSVWKKLKSSTLDKTIIDELQWAAPILGAAPRPVQQRLSKLVASDKNGFIHEAAAVKLALALLELSFEKGFIMSSPRQIDVKQTQRLKVSWSEVWKPNIGLNCSYAKPRAEDDPRFSLPSWLEEGNEDIKLIYWVGVVLRTAVVGGNDFTGNRWKNSKTNGYKGLRTGWFKRRMGMMHSPELLVGEYATISNWMAELLMTCLQWPGFESSHVQHNDLKRIDSVEELQRVLTRRLAVLNSLHCEASDMPALVTRVDRPEKEGSRYFRLVTVQQLLPMSQDFIGDPTLDNPVTRAQNRDHLSSICQLTYKTLVTKRKAEKGESKVSADLIVFAEVAAHPDDQDLLKRLADKTKSIVFAGLVFFDHNGRRVNIARWFIPDYRQSGRQWIIRDQGKAHVTEDEIEMGVSGCRPVQHILEVYGNEDGPFRISGAICYDATDLKLASDLKGKTDLFVVAAHNKDVRTFDTMVAALNYHMYQHVVVVNKGEYGGSTIQAPYKQQYDRMISHSHGVGQVSINVADLDLAAFRRKENKKLKAVKTKPAG